MNCTDRNQAGLSDTELSAQVNDFIKYCEYERRLSPHTTKAYRLDLQQFQDFVKEAQPMEQSDFAEKAVIRGFVQSLSGKPRTIRRKLAALKSFYRFLEAEDAKFMGTLKHLNMRVRVGQSLPRALSFQAISKLLVESHSPIIARKGHPGSQSETDIRNAALVELMFASGMRVAEMSYLRCEDVDLAEGQVRVLGKGARQRILPICVEGVRTIMEAYLSVRPSNGSEYFFLNRHGRRLSEQSIRAIIRRLAKSAGVGHVTPHMLRHSVATLLLEQEFDLRYLQHFLGHSSITTTTIYAQVTASAHRKFLEAKHPRRLVKFGEDSRAIAADQHHQSALSEG